MDAKKAGNSMKTLILLSALTLSNCMVSPETCDCQEKTYQVSVNHAFSNGDTFEVYAPSLIGVYIDGSPYTGYTMDGTYIYIQETNGNQITVKYCGFNN